MKLILSRFCSQEEFDLYMRGEILVNNKDFSKISKSTSKGFCWFDDDPEYAIEYLSGIVTRDICITVETDSENVNTSMGYYWGCDGPEWMPEYCCTTYDNKRFKLIEATNKFKYDDD